MCINTVQTSAYTTTLSIDPINAWNHNSKLVLIQKTLIFNFNLKVALINNFI